ncbi:MAG: carbon-nitrogen hydrolase family protein [Propioniciclava sp.]|uniref:carbon-nitrogen hydrolase family protein n=1 Tax=Propioniciclava sp. TaxID=2038686 RepID=UPI0039E284FB
MTSLCVAVVQAGSTVFDTAHTLTRAEAFLREASARGARLVVLPEAFLGGYPKGLDFGITVGSRAPAGRELFRRYVESAVTLPGPEVDALAAWASELGIDIVAGVIERDGGTLYCSSVFITAEDGHVATHRKLMPTAAERYLWGQGDGSGLATVTTPYGTLGSAICWENYMPLLRTALYARGVELWCAPTVDDREVWASTMTHIALEGRCFVLSANQYLLRSQMPADVSPVQGDDPNAVLIAGGSMIVSPLGDVLAGPLRGGEGVLIATLDLDDLTRARFDLDVVGHYARPDVFTLQVDTSPRTTVAEDPGRRDHPTA